MCVFEGFWYMVLNSPPEGLPPGATATIEFALCGAHWVGSTPAWLLAQAECSVIVTCGKHEEYFLYPTDETTEG